MRMMLECTSDFNPEPKEGAYFKLTPNLDLSMLDLISKIWYDLSRMSTVSRLRDRSHSISRKLEPVI